MEKESKYQCWKLQLEMGGVDQGFKELSENLSSCGNKYFGRTIEGIIKPLFEGKEEKQLLPALFYENGQNLCV